NHGHLRVWRSESVERAVRVALSSFDPTGGWVVARTANHGHWVPRRILLKIRHVPAKFPPSRARYLRELPPRPGSPTELFPLYLGFANRVGAGAIDRSRSRFNVD